MAHDRPDGRGGLVGWLDLPSNLAWAIPDPGSLASLADTLIP